MHGSAQWEGDHAAPYRDVPHEGYEAAAARVIAIGYDRLMDWAGRFRRYTHPGSFGDSGCEFAYSVAYRLRPDVDRCPRRVLPGFEAHDAAVATAVEALSRQSVMQVA